MINLICLAVMPLAMMDSVPAPLAPPLLTAESAILIDDATGAVLYEKDARSHRYPASTTKIMTALLLVENCAMSDKITAPADVKTVGESSIYLEPYETLTVQDALYALMVKSANDVAYSVACHIAGSVEKFSEMMNKRAVELGCTDSQFKNPHGLRDEDHYTSAHDLALIGRAAMTHSEIREACRTKRVLIDRSANQLNRYLISKDKFLDDPNAEGIKTGWTIPAGSCFVGAKQINGWRLISVVLKSGNWLADTQSLMDYGFTKFRQVRALGEGAACAEAVVERGDQTRVATRAQRGIWIVADRGSINREAKIELSPIAAPVREGDIVGTAEAVNIDGKVVKVSLVAASSVLESRSPIATATSIPRLFWALGLAAISIVVYALTRRKPRKRFEKKRQHG